MQIMTLKPLHKLLADVGCFIRDAATRKGFSIIPEMQACIGFWDFSLCGNSVFAS
jgi:hypothetical protein